MPMRGRAVRQNHENYLRASAKDIAQLHAVRKDAALRDEARLERAREIENRLRERFRDILAASETLVDGARAEYIENMPAAILTRAAFKKPERAAAIRAMAETAGLAELREMAQLAIAEKDAPAAYGIRAAVGKGLPKDAPLAANEEARERTAIINALDGIVAGESRNYLADLVAAQWGVGTMRAMGPEGAWDITAMNPMAALQAARESATVPTGPNETRTLPETEVHALLAHAGVPKEPPTVPALVAA